MVADLGVKGNSEKVTCHSGNEIYELDCPVFHSNTALQSNQVMPLASGPGLNMVTDLDVMGDSEKATSQVGNEPCGMNCSAPHPSIVPLSKQVISGSGRPVHHDFNRNITHLGMMSNSEKEISHVGNEIHLMKSPEAFQLTERSSSEVTPGNAESVNMGNYLDVVRNSVVATNSSESENLMQTCAAHPRSSELPSSQVTSDCSRPVDIGVASSGVVLNTSLSTLKSPSQQEVSHAEEVINRGGSELYLKESSTAHQVNGNCSTVPKNKDLDDKFEEEIFGCAYCDTLSARRKDIEIHIQEKHSHDIGIVSNSPVVPTSLDKELNAVRNSEELIRLAGNEIPALERCAAQQSTPTSDQVISDENVASITLNQATDSGVGSNSEEVIFRCAYCDTFSAQRKDIDIHIREKHSFKCAYCDTFSVRREEIEIHVVEKHSQGIGTAGNTTVGAMNMDNKDLKTVCDSEELIRLAGNEIPAMESSVAQQSPPTSDPVISDNRSPERPLNQPTDSRVGTKSAKETFKCAYCDTFSGQRKEIEIHIHEKHSFKCAYCDTFSARREEIEIHIIEKHSQGIGTAGNTPVGAMNMDSKDLKTVCDSEELTRLAGNGIPAMGSSAAQQSTPSSHPVISDNRSPEMPINQPTDSRVGSKSENTMSDSEELTRLAGNKIPAMESSVAQQSTLMSHPVISDSSSPEMPLNQPKDSGVGSNSKGATFKCAYCDTFLTRREEIKIHIIEKHSHNIGTASDSPAGSVNTGKEGNAGSNSEELTRLAGNGIPAMESSETQQSTPMSHLVISDNRSPEMPLNQPTDSPVGSKSEKETFKCAYCDTFSAQSKEIEIHIREKHPFKCAYCDKFSTQREEIENHVREKHFQYEVEGRESSGHDANNNDRCPTEARLGDHEQQGVATRHCPFCPKVLKRVYNTTWTSHLMRCQTKRNCPFCGEGFKAIYPLLNHVVCSHEDEDPSHLVPESIVKNAAEDSKSGKFRCCYCTEELDTVRSLVQHWLASHKCRMKSKVLEKKVCWICQKELKSNKILKRHIQSHTGEKTIPCDHCDRYFATKSEQRIHMRRLTLERCFKCEQCGKGFKTLVSLKNHLKSHNNERPFQCSHCSKSFKRKEKMKEHVRIHTGERPYQCRYCDKAFAKSRQRLRHEQISHNVGAEYNCTHCPKTFKRSASLRLHIRRVHLHSDVVLRCDKCSYVSLTKYNMDIHYVTHTGERPFKCDYCPMKYSQPSRLKIHMRLHTGEKPYSCDQCDKAFIDSYSLIRHKRTHTGEKPYKCSYCTRSFAQGCQRLFHERTHTGEKPYGCSKCDKKFSRRQELNKHLATHEKGKQKVKRKREDSSRDLQCEKRITRCQELKKPLTTNKKSKQQAKGEKEESSKDSQSEKRFTRSQELNKRLATPEEGKQKAKRKGQNSSKDLQCEKRFTRNQELNKHLVTPENVRLPEKKKSKEASEDSQCEKRITRSQDQNKHLKAHGKTVQQSAKRKRKNSCGDSQCHEKLNKHLTKHEKVEEPPAKRTRKDPSEDLPRETITRRQKLNQHAATRGKVKKQTTKKRKDAFKDSLRGKKFACRQELNKHLMACKMVKQSAKTKRKRK